MNSYFCKPKNQNKNTKILVLFMTCLAFFLFFLSIRFPQIKAVLQLLTAALILLVIQISSRFLLTEYRYGFEDGSLLFSSRQGRREHNLGSVSVTTETKLFSKDAWEKEKEKFTVSSRFSYCQNLTPAQPYYLLTPEENGTYVLLVFEPDERLVSLIVAQTALYSSAKETLE